MSGLNIPGFKLLKELLVAKKDFQEIFTASFYSRETLLLDASAVDTLNFALEGVDAVEEVEKASQAAEEFMARKLD